MGDVLRTTFLLPGLKEKYPSSTITWIVAPQSVEILQGNPYLSRILPLNEKTFDVLACETFDLSINLDLSPASLSLAALALAKKKIGYYLGTGRKVISSNAFAKQWLDMSAYDEKKKKNRQTYQYWMAQIVGLSRADYEIYTPLNVEASKKAEAFRKKHRLDGTTVVGINPGAGKRWPLKKWTDEGYSAIIRRLAARGIRVLLLGGPEEKEILDKLAKGSSGKAINTGTDNPLPVFFALVDLCDMVITGDTLAMHAALGLKKKVVAIFGPTSSAEIELYRRGTRVVTPASCVCCYRPNCQVQPDCMQLVSTDAVWKAVERYIP
jgi:heptosyltransferase-2